MGPLHPKRQSCVKFLDWIFIMDARGKAWLLEVNDYPAIASGTMEHVDTQVYTNLVRDLLRLVVLPKVDGTDVALGGWHVIDWGETAKCRGKLTRGVPKRDRWFYTVLLYAVLLSDVLQVPIDDFVAQASGWMRNSVPWYLRFSAIWDENAACLALRAVGGAGDVGGLGNGGI